MTWLVIVIIGVYELVRCITYAGGSLQTFKQAIAGVGIAIGWLRLAAALLRLLEATDRMGRVQFALDGAAWATAVGVLTTAYGPAQAWASQIAAGVVALVGIVALAWAARETPEQESLS